MLPSQVTENNEEKQAIINKHSALTTMQNLFTLDQRKLVNPLLIFAIVTLRKTPTQRTFVVRLSELRKYAGINNTNTKKLKDDLQILRRKEIKFNFFNKSNDDRWDCFAFLGGVTITRGIIEYSFPHQIVNTMLHPEMYARINDNINGLFASIYSLVIYEYAKDYINVSIPIMELDNFREFLGIANKYKKINDLKKRVLDVAVNEMNEKTDIAISYKLIRSGVKYTHIRFIASESKSVLKVLPPSPPTVVDQNVPIALKKLISLLPEKLRRMNKARVLIDEYLTDRGVDWIKSNINYFNKHSKKKNFPYLKIVFENDSGEENRIETELETVKLKTVAAITREKEEEKEKNNVDFIAMIDKAEEYFQNLSPDKQTKILTELPKMCIFIPAKYKKHRNFGAKLKGYFEVKEITFMK